MNMASDQTSGRRQQGIVHRDRTAVRRLIVQAYVDGATQVDVAHRYGVHVQTVRAYCADVGVNARPRRKCLDEEDLDQARTMLGQGSGLRSVARQFGMSHTTLAKRLREDADHEIRVNEVDDQMPHADTRLPIPSVEWFKQLDRVAPRIHQLALAWAELAAQNVEEEEC